MVRAFIRFVTNVVGVITILFEAYLTTVVFDQVGQLDDNLILPLIFLRVVCVVVVILNIVAFCISIYGQRNSDPDKIRLSARLFLVSTLFFIPIGTCALFTTIGQYLTYQIADKYK